MFEVRQAFPSQRWKAGMNVSDRMLQGKWLFEKQVADGDTERTS